jgi:hypothetical protein
MLKVIEPPISSPVSDKSAWHAFGSTYDAVDLNRTDISYECLAWLDSINLKPITCSMLTIFPDKIPQVVIDSPLCEQDNHTRIYWIYDAPVKLKWYKVNHPLGIDNHDKLVGSKPYGEENNFTSQFTGWFPKPELLVQMGEAIIEPNTCVLINAGSPILAVSTTNVRSKVFAVGILDKNSFGSNGMPFADAVKYVV